MSSVKQNIRLLILFNLLIYNKLNSQKFISTIDTINKTIKIIDSKDSFEVFNSNLNFLWIPDSIYSIGFKSINGTHVKPDIEVKKTLNGFRLLVKFKNKTNKKSSLGELIIGQINLKDSVYYRNTNYTFQEELFHAKRNIQFMSSAHVYPSTTSYSPLTIIRDNKYIIGTSIIYPFEQYKHTVNQMVVGTFFDNKELGWAISIQLNKNSNGQTFYEGGELMPNEAQVYTIDIVVDHVLNSKSDWKKVIRPYKNYFINKFGKQKYVKDANPIIGYVGVSDHFNNLSNELGFTNIEDNKSLKSHPLRPDINGFESTINYLYTLAKSNLHQRVMVWAPSGLYFNNKHRNYPFQVTSNWINQKLIHQKTNNMKNGVQMYSQLSKKIKEVGLWWGRVGEISKSWDSPNFEVFNPKNEEHWNLYDKEIDIALKAGIKCLGLDSFNDINGWDQILWLKRMTKKTKGKIKFISELYSFDVAHLYCGFMYADWNMGGKHELADYLIPNNEKWILIVPEKFGKEKLDSYSLKCAENNYNPCILTYFGEYNYKPYKAIIK